MPGPGAGKYFPPGRTPIPGQGRNVALEAMSEAADRDVQRQQITAQLQQEAMRMTMEGAKLKAAAAQDLSQGITDASQAFMTQAENKQQRDFASTEAQKARTELATREQTAQTAAMDRTKVQTAATKVNKDAERDSEERVRIADRELVTNTAKLKRLDVELDTLQGYLTSGLGLSTDSEKATEQRERTKEQILKINEQRLELGGGISRSILERGFEISLNASLATKQNNQAKLATQKQLDISMAKREQAVKARDQQLPVQVARFAAVHGEKHIDAGLAEGISPKAMVDRLFMLHNDADMSNPKAFGFGLMRAMAQNEGKDSELLNKVQSKLGPLGMATLDAFIMTIEGYGDQLGEPESPEIGAYRDEVLSRASSRLAMGRQNRAYSAIQLGFAADEGKKFIDSYRQEHGRPPSTQEYNNFKRGIDLSHLPGSLDMKLIYGTPTGPQFGVPIYGDPGEIGGLVAPGAAEALKSPEKAGIPISTGAEAFGHRGGVAARKGVSAFGRSVGRGTKTTAGAGVSAMEALGGFGAGFLGIERKRRPKPTGGRFQ